MKLSDAGLQLIADFEGFRAHVYRDIAGYPTIGYGHKLRDGERYPDGIDAASALALLREDAGTAAACVNRLVTVPLTQHQFDALVSFTYNLGCGALQRSTLLRLLNAGDYTGASRELLRWDRAAGSISEGLLNRRVAERALFNQEDA